jgi:hypothetical protein
MKNLKCIHGCCGANFAAHFHYHNSKEHLSLTSFKRSLVIMATFIEVPIHII